jgi:hypothetical protein
MNKKSISRTSKMMIVLQVVIVVGALSFVFLFGPKMNYPSNNAVIQGRVVEFGIRNAEVILIDDNPDFSSPVKIELENSDTTNIRFEPGTYYWKTAGIFEGGVRKFVIPSEVGLELENSSLKNTGNVPVNISKRDEAGISGLVILDVEVEHQIEENKTAIYQGEQHNE